MRCIKYVITCIALVQSAQCLPCLAQDAINKIIDSGDDSSRFVFVFIAEGYTREEMQKFDDDCQSIVNYFFSSVPWNDYRSFINVYSIFIPSQQSGADIPSEGIYVDTVFDATFDSYGISSLLTVNDAKAFNAAAQIPAFDAVFIMVNDNHYGGSGGATAVLSTHSAAGEIALHEAGHLIARLADEYETPYSIYSAVTGLPNITDETARENIPWRDWIDPDIPLPTPESITDRIGLFEGAEYSSTGMYRPKHNCRMRNLGVQYCEICTEAIVRSIYHLVAPIDTFSPEESEITLKDTAITLWIQPVNIRNTVLEIAWELDGRIIDNRSQTSYKLEPYMVPSGTHTVRVRVKDATDKVRTDTEGLLISEHTWMVNKIGCSGNVSGTVVDAENNVIIKDVTATLLPSSETVYTDSHGEFQFNNIPCGSYTAIINKAGYEETNINVSITGEAETVLHIALNNKISRYSITGSIVGWGQKSVTVKLYGKVSSKIQTSADGNFTFPSLPPGNYIIIPEAPRCRFFPACVAVTVQETPLQGITFLSCRNPLSAD
jgi:hypothetical protein